MPYTPALDGLRGIAVLLVLLHHFTIVPARDVAGVWLAKFALLGWSGG